MSHHLSHIHRLMHINLQGLEASRKCTITPLVLAGFPTCSGGHMHTHKFTTPFPFDILDFKIICSCYVPFC